MFKSYREKQIPIH